MSQPKPLRNHVLERLIPTIVILVVIYADVVGSVNMMHWHIRLPAPAIIGHYFQVFSVFDAQQENNVEYSVQLLARDSNDPDADATLREFDLRKYFAGPPNEGQKRVARMLRHDRQRNVLVDEIKRVYQLQHPDDVVEQVRIYQVSWPASSAGFAAERHQSTRQLIVQK